MSAMAIVKLVLQIILVIFSLLLTLLILMHKGKAAYPICSAAASPRTQVPLASPKRT